MLETRMLPQCQQRHMWETSSLNGFKVMLWWFIRFPEFTELLFHLGKSPLALILLWFHGKNSMTSWKGIWYFTCSACSCKTLCSHTSTKRIWKSIFGKLFRYNLPLSRLIVIYDRIGPCYHRKECPGNELHKIRVKMQSSSGVKPTKE